MSYKIPLSVYIIWHPDFMEGEKIGNFLYSTLCRNPEKPLIRSLGIPVYFRCKNENGGSAPINISFEESEYVAIVPLISDEFVVDRQYGSYLDELLTECNLSKNKRRIYPVALSHSAFNVSPNFPFINFVRVNTQITPSSHSNYYQQIKSPILHELCRLMMNMKRATEETSTLLLEPPVKLFISHSKHDDSKLDALNFRDFINKATQLKTFFDANDIAYGTDFGDEIKKAVGESALVVFQSDSYSDREWCRIEVLTAKTEGCPMVIVNAIQNGEKRAFPYLGNYPSIRFKGDYQAIIDLTLEQVLYNLFTRKLLNSLTNLYELKTDRILTTPPELFNFIQLKKQGLQEHEEYGVVIYPDPPLGTEELEILNQLDDNFVFITPLTLPSIT